MDINNIKYPGGRTEPARCPLPLGPSPLAFVYLAAVVRRGQAEEEERGNAVHSGKPSPSDGPLEAFTRAKCYLFEELNTIAGRLNLTDTKL